MVCSLGILCVCIDGNQIIMATSKYVLLCGHANLELIVASLLRNNFKLCLSVFYRPPSSPSSIFDTLCDTLLSIDHAYFSNFVILGDFIM